MKKQTLLAAALLCAAFSAAASDIEVYGVLDYGLTWQDRTNADGSDSAALQMTSGQYIGSRFGIKGTETVLAPTRALWGRTAGSSAAMPGSFSTGASGTCHLAVWAPWWAATAPTPASVTS